MENEELLQLLRTSPNEGVQATELEKSANAHDPNYKHFFKGGSGDGDPNTGELVWGLSFTQALDLSTLTGIWADGMYYAIDKEQ